MASQAGYRAEHEKVVVLEQRLEEALASQAVLEKELGRYKVVVDQASDLIHSVTPEGRFLYVNETWKEVLGYSDEEIANLSLMDIVEPGCKGACVEIFKCLLQGDKIDRNETTFIAKNGDQVKVEGRCRTHFQDGEALMMTGIFRDITEQARQQEALQASEMRYHDLFENAHDLIQIVRPDGKLLYVNRSWRHIFGDSEEEIAEGLSIFEIISHDCQDHCQNVFKQVLSEEKMHIINTVFQAKDGRKIIIEGNAKCKFEDGKPLYTQCMFHDVTAKRKMEAELLKAQKLDSVGVFAGGIAHDFNNLLTAILGNITMAKVFLDEDHPAWLRLERTENASLQAKNLTQQLLTFSKGGAPIRKTTSINELLEDSVSFTLRGSNVKIDYQLAADLRLTKVDSGQLSQVTQNLALNASQAMPDGGVLLVSSENMTLHASDEVPLPAGDYVHLCFRDQGHGIHVENLQKIFDPYFSSKETGSGLGLAVSYSIIKQHDGLITAVSELEKGSAFHIYLPAAAEKDLIAEKQQGGVAEVSGKILFMDDEEIIIDVAISMLTELGCQVEVARDGQEAIDKYQAALATDQPFIGVIMDLTIPGGMGGEEAMERLREIDPAVKVIVSSGYANDPIMANHSEYGFVGVVPKPYSIEELSGAVEQLIS